MARKSVSESDDAVDAAATEVDPTVYPYFKRGVDPRDLRAVGNVREVGDIRERRPDLVASVAQHGVDPMVSVINVASHPDDGVLEVLVGFHRTAAAVAVKELENPDLTVDVLVHAPGTTREHVLVAQGIENMHREGYTPIEEAVLYEQLALEGLDDDTIARRLTRPVERVQAGRAVAASPRTRATGEAQPEADLFTLAQLAEFADDEEVHAKLTDLLKNRPHDFDFAISRLRRHRAQVAKYEEETKKLSEQGYFLIEDENDLPEGALSLDVLCTGDAPTPLDPAAHTACPGRAAAVDVDAWLDVVVTEYCVDYAAHGHHTIASVKIAAAEAQLRADGVPLVDPGADGLTDLTRLYADEHAKHTLTADEHANCPGHAAHAKADPYRSTADVHYVCTDYAAHGHVLRAAVAAAETEHDASLRSAEVKRAGHNNKLWRDAKADRREWLTKFFAGWRRRKPADLPARVHHWLALAPVLASDYLAEAAPTHHYACALLKLPEPVEHHRDNNPITALLRKKTTTETQAVLIRLAQVIGACEEHWNHAYTSQADNSWRRPSDDSRFYFELLDALGYPLTHVERLITNPDLDIENWPHLAPTKRNQAA